jgi:integrase
LLEVSKRDSNRSFYPFIYLALHSALRYSEIINIRLGDLDLKAKTITISKTKNKRQHIVYLFDDMFNVLDVHVTRLVRLQPENWAGMKFGDGKFCFYADAYLFPAEKGDKPAYFIKAWRRARKAAGLENSQVVFHTTRYTVLSSLANDALSYFELVQIANHKDYRSTRRYTKGDAEMIRKNFNRIGDLIK